MKAGQNSAEVTALQTIAKPGGREDAMRAADQEVRRLVRYGVSAEELGVEVDVSLTHTRGMAAAVAVLR